MKKTSLKDIASQLGVSPTLVSFVLNGQGDKKGINPETQKKVRTLAKKLNFKPNELARSLRLGNSKTIGLIITDISNDFYSTLAKSIEEKASAHGYNVIFMNSEEDPEKEAKLIELLLDRSVDGLIISTTSVGREEMRQLRNSNIPFVLMDRYVPGVKTNYVIVDNYKGAYEMTEHLLALGLNRIALLYVTPSHLTTMKHRISGYKDALRSKGMSANNKLIREIPHDSISERMEIELKQLILEENIQSIFFLNNKLAKAGLELINKYKLRIPQDLSIASFDDIDLFRFSNPTITSVIQPKEEIGMQAFEILLEQIQNKDSDSKKKQVVLPVKLVVRESCGSLFKRTFDEI